MKISDINLFEPTGAVFSPCEEYRYALWRRWDTSEPLAMFIGLNPSTATATEDDPTVRRCIRFSKDWGYGGLIMANIFAYRATDPRVMKAHEEPVGVDNNYWLSMLRWHSVIAIAAWGIHGKHNNRGVEASHVLVGTSLDLHCLGKTKDGNPKHPLYLRADTKPQVYQQW